MELKPSISNDLPADWKEDTLKNLSDKIMVGIASAATHAYAERGVILLRNQNIKAGFLDANDVLYIKEEFEKTFANKRLKEGDLITARTGYPGTTCIVPKQYEGCQSFTTLITRPRRELISSEYLNFYINSERGQNFFETNQIGGGQKNVNAGTLRTMPIPYPATKSEQTAIATALSDADALIASLEKLIAKKRLIKQGVMQKLLEPKKGWKFIRIGDVSEVCAGGTPSTSIPNYWGGNIRWMNSGELNLKKVYEVENRITEFGLTNSATKLIPLFCVLIGLAGQGKTRGTVAMNMVELCTNQSIASIFPCEAFNQNYVYHYLDSQYNELRSLSAGDGGRGGLNLSIIKNLEIPVPPTKEDQDGIALILDEIDQHLNLLEVKLKKLKVVKQGMMQNLLTGKIRLV